MTHYCDCGNVLKFDKTVSDVREDDNLVCNVYYCDNCYGEFEIMEELEK